jgi:hypothetical protein
MGEPAGGGGCSCVGAQLQYLYFFTSKASKWVYLRGGVLVRVCVVHHYSSDIGGRGVSKGGGEQRRLKSAN